LKWLLVGGWHLIVVLELNDSLKALLDAPREELRQTGQLVARCKSLHIGSYGTVSIDTTTIADSVK